MKYFKIVLVVLFVAGSSCTKPEKPTLEEQPVNTPEQEKLFLEIDIEKIDSAQTSDEIPVVLEDGSVYALKIQKKEETMPGIISISGFIDDEETGQATLIFRDGKLTGKVNMYEEGVSYNLAFDEESGQHFIIPIVPVKRDVLPGGEPLEVPRSNNRGN